MANQDAPFGFRAVRMSGSGPSTNGQTQYLIANGYNTAIFQGDPVEVVAGGSLEDRYQQLPVDVLFDRSNTHLSPLQSLMAPLPTIIRPPKLYLCSYLQLH